MKDFRRWNTLKRCRRWTTTMRWLNKLKDFFVLPPLELSPEREKELIEKIAQEVSRRGIEIPALLVSWGVLPSSPIYGNLVLTPLAPFLEGLGINGYEIAAFIKNRENIQALIKRIEQLKDESG